jgi:hypothetical protein
LPCLAQTIRKSEPFILAPYEIAFAVRSLSRRCNLAESAAVPPFSGTAEFTRVTACCPS